MTSSDTPSETDATADFERELIDLIARSFARGAAIEQTWEITLPVTDAPNWMIEIRRTQSDDDSPYDPEFIDE